MTSQLNAPPTDGSAASDKVQEIDSSHFSTLHHEPYEPLSERRESFVALSQFVIANGMMEEVKEAFRNRPHLVDGAPGFVRMEVMVPRDNPEQIWLVTYWTDEESYRVWHHSHLYRESHKGIPKGLKLVPGSAKIRLLDFVCS